VRVLRSSSLCTGSTPLADETAKDLAIELAYNAKVKVSEGASTHADYPICTSRNLATTSGENAHLTDGVSNARVITDCNRQS
jgi:hypothetical protein